MAVAERRGARYNPRKRVGVVSMAVHPLLFEPIFKPRLWGGRNLAALLGKNLPEKMLVGESWEVADLDHDVSVVREGPSAGQPLDRVVRNWGKDLIGNAPLVDGRFPLLIKFLDAVQPLSVQVHPGERAVRQRGTSIRAKHEAWYVLHAEPGAYLYHGLEEGIDEIALREALVQGRIESVLRRIPARKGHCVYIPGGVVHALGAGVVVAEIQTPSDVTYRLYDWGRVDPVTGAERPLHVSEALSSMSFSPSPPPSGPLQHVASVWTTVTNLVRCDSFVVERVRMAAGVEQNIPYAEMVIWIVLEGHGTLRWKGVPGATKFCAGDTVVLPAALEDGAVQAHADCMWLEVTLPIPSSLAGYERPERGALIEPQSLVPLNVPGRGESPSAR